MSGQTEYIGYVFATKGEHTLERAFKGKGKEWTQVLKRFETELSFKQKLLKEPIPGLKEHGIEFPEDAKVKIVEGKEGEMKIDPVEGKGKEITMALPPRVGAAALSDDDLDKVVGAGGACIAGFGFAVGAIVKFKAHKDNPT